VLLKQYGMVIALFTRILTDLERRQAKAYIKQDGERTLNVRVLTIRARRHLSTIEADLALLKELLATYERSKTK
jgi:cellobiose-specific phosphotransferase system component IIA